MKKIFNSPIFKVIFNMNIIISFILIFAGILKENYILTFIGLIFIIIDTLTNIETHFSNIKFDISSLIDIVDEWFFIVEKEDDKYVVKRKKYMKNVANNKNVYGIFKFENIAYKIAHTLNSGDYEECIGEYVYVSNNNGCYVGYEEFFDINKSCIDACKLSLCDIQKTTNPGSKYFIIDSGFDSNGNKVLVLEREGLVWIYKYEDIYKYERYSNLKLIKY